MKRLSALPCTLSPKGKSIEKGSENLTKGHDAVPRILSVRTGETPRGERSGNSGGLQWGSQERVEGGFRGTRNVLYLIWVVATWVHMSVKFTELWDIVTFALCCTSTKIL